jgi:ribose 1,5-bisphosphokinase PhnN
MSFAGLEQILAEVAAKADAEQFVIDFVGVRDDWVSPGDYIVTIGVRRTDLQLSHEFIIRSNGKYVSNASPTSLRTKVRNRHRQLAGKLERRLNRTAPDADGFYRRTLFYDNGKYYFGET